MVTGVPSRLEWQKCLLFVKFWHQLNGPSENVSRRVEIVGSNEISHTLLIASQWLNASVFEPRYQVRIFLHSNMIVLRELIIEYSMEFSHRYDSIS